MREEFLQLIEKHQGIIHKISIIYSKNDDDKKDLFQEIIFQLWKSYPKYRGDAQFSTWMYRVALNTALMNNRQQSIDLLDRQAIESLKNRHFELYHHEINVNVMSLYMAIDQLSPINKAIIILYLEQRTYEDIADILGLTKSNIVVRIIRIKDELKNIMQYERK
jgi:RNA polymerase sigma-70 factor (ECF subfamily)